MKQKTDTTRVLLKDALALHPHLRHMHWTTDVKDGGGNVIGVNHHHFVWEFGLTTGIHCSGRNARERLADTLVGYYSDLHGPWVSFAVRRDNFDVYMTISDEERKRRDAEKAKKEENDKRKRGKRHGKRSDETEIEESVQVATEVQAA